MRTPPDALKYLADIHRAGTLLQQFTRGKALEDYVRDPLLQSAVERQFEIIGEAMGQMLRAFPELEGRFPEARRIISFRNLLIHGYSSISHPVVWGVLENSLPQLLSTVESLLAGGLPA
jgi:uncharacterized protein with HEPN domain